jgi:ATP-dependent DNA ligase
MTNPNWPSLSFHDRQRQWIGEERTFIQNNGRGKKPNTWSIKVVGDRVTTIYGVQGGQMQTTNYQGKAKNVGRSNAITAEQDALAEARRDVLKKWDFEGYDELFEGRNIDQRNDNPSIQHLLTSLPGSFSLYKPENNLKDQKKLYELAEQGKAWFTVKRDGMAKLIVKDYYDNISIYSRRARRYHKDEGPTELADGTLDYSVAVPWNVRFPHLAQAFRDMGLPPGTMLAGELIYPRNSNDNFAHVQSITKSLTEQALKDQQEKGYPYFYWWDIPFFDGQDWVSTMPVGQRLTILRQIWDSLSKEVQHWIVPISIETFSGTEPALVRAKELDIEGWVVVDPNAVYGNKGWNLKGKPDRPSTCAKLKPKGEDDFIAMWNPPQGYGEWGTGKHEKGKLVTLPDGNQVVHAGVGSIALYQYNTKGEPVFICNCASGMEYGFQARLIAGSFPFVCRVEYAERTYISDGEKTNALRHPVFIQKREDKSAEECINSKL